MMTSIGGQGLLVALEGIVGPLNKNNEFDDN